MAFTGMEKGQMGRIKKIKYRGTNPDLIDGSAYTLTQYAAIAGVGYRCFQTRASGKQVITDKELQPHNKHKIPKRWRNTTNFEVSNLDTLAEEISQEWLGRKL